MPFFQQIIPINPSSNDILFYENKEMKLLECNRSSYISNHDLGRSNNSQETHKMWIKKILKNKHRFHSNTTTTLPWRLGFTNVLLWSYACNETSPSPGDIITKTLNASVNSCCQKTWNKIRVFFFNAESEIDYPPLWLLQC